MSAALPSFALLHAAKLWNNVDGAVPAQELRGAEAECLDQFLAWLGRLLQSRISNGILAQLFCN
jgi:hypothetical protein